MRLHERDGHLVGDTAEVRAALLRKEKGVRERLARVEEERTTHHVDVARLTPVLNREKVSR